MTPTGSATSVPSPQSLAFSPTYYSSPDGGDDQDSDDMDFCGSASAANASPTRDDVDSIDHYTPNSAISPVARRILMGNDFDFDNDTQEESGNISGRNIPLGVPSSPDDNDDEGSFSRRDSQHSLPNLEELKLSVAAAAAAGGGESSSFWSSSNRKKIIYPLAACALALVIVFATIGAMARADESTYESQKKQIGETPDTTTFDDVGDAPSNNGQFDDRLTQLQNYMIEHGVTAMDQFHDAGSNKINTPQSQAIRWLAIEDRQFPVLPAIDKDPSTLEGYSLVTRYAMTVLYFATDGKNWDNSLNFLDPQKSTCEWFYVFPPPKGELGVLCNLTTQRIIGLSLISNNLRGTIPSELSQLTSLEYIESIENTLAGTIPVEWQKLTRMKTLVMAFSHLTGTLPSWMPQAWPDMEFLYLSNNNLSGSIPAEFFEFQKLSVLALDDNILTGNTDVIWNSMQSLEHLYLEDNDFTGTLPTLVSRFNSNLIHLDLSSNRLSGPLPGDIFHLRRLEVLDLHENAFNSNVPWNITQENYHLKFVALHDNILSGTISSTISNLKKLSHLDVTSNRLTGTIPKELERLSDTMSYLFLGANDYQEGPIPSLVYALTNLRELSLKSSQRTGSISGVIGVLDAMLVLDLDDNRLTGSIPNEIGMMTNLQFLLLNRNELSSSVPGDSLAKLKNLRFLLLDNNHLFGDLNPICGLENLNTAYVDCGEVACIEGCCRCCVDRNSCHDMALISSHDPVWESNYNRQFFDFSGGDDGRFYSNRDDDYWG